MGLAVWFTLLSIPLLALISFRKSKSPPGPWGLPLIGHLHLLGGLPPHRALTSIAQKYGPIVSLKLGMVPAVVVSSKEIATELFTSRDLEFSGRPYLVLGDYICYGSISIGTSSYGEHHKGIRKLCTSNLFTNRSIDSFAWIRKEEISQLLNTLFKFPKEHNQLLELRSLLSIFTFNTLTRTLISKRYFNYEGYETDDAAEALEFKETTDEVVKLAIKPCLSNFVPWYLRWLDWQIPYYKLVHSKQDKFLQKVVDEHKNTTRKYKDFLDILLEFFGEGAHSDTNTKANLLDMMTAGFDTSTVSSEWIMAAVRSEPRVLRNAQEELDRVVGRSRMVRESDLANLEYLRAIIKETFRRYPTAIILLPRISTRETSLGGYRIPKGTTLLVNLWALQMNPATWEDPSKFLPERFLGSSIDFKGQDFEFLPFGSGRRKCPGMPLGMRGVELLVANLIHGFHWEGPAPSMEEHFAGACKMKHPVRATPIPRLPDEAYANV